MIGKGISWIQDSRGLSQLDHENLKRDVPDTDFLPTAPNPPEAESRAFRIRDSSCLVFLCMFISLLPLGGREINKRWTQEVGGGGMGGTTNPATIPTTDHPTAVHGE